MSAMDSIISHHHQQQCYNQQNSGLLRYRSAPSSFLLASLLDDDNTTAGGCVDEEAFRRDDSRQQQRYAPPTSSNMETVFSELVSSNNNNGWSNSEHVKREEEAEEAPVPPQQNGYSYGSQLVYPTQQIQGLLPSDSSPGAAAAASSGGFDGGFGVANSNLIRQKSSPAGFFSNECGLGALREVGSFRGSDVSNGQATTASTLSFSSSTRPSSLPSCLNRMPQIAEAENEILEADSSRNLVNDHNGSTECYVPSSFTSEFWEGPALFNSQKSASEDEIMFSSQDSDFRSRNIGLTHHLSLPSSSNKMESIERFLQIQGTVPCKIRAKRGFATHPRSIAERVRRTRISERIKILEGLFPKSDKQTSTADMLDSAVDYIKDLQEQVKMLTNVKARCKCTSVQKQYC